MSFFIAFMSFMVKKDICVSVRDMVFKRLCSRRLQSLRMGVQNEGDRCPKWGSPLRGSGKRDKLDKRDKREKLEEQEIQVEQPQTSPASVLSVSAVAKTPPAPDLDFSEIAGLQALAEYMAMCPADAGDGFSKKETQEFEDMMLITFTEMERRKYNEKAIAEGRPQIPYTDAAPRTIKGKYAPDMIKAWKDRSDFFALAV